MVMRTPKVTTLIGQEVLNMKLRFINHGLFLFPLRYHNQIVKIPIFYLKVHAAVDGMEDNFFFLI